MMKAILSETGGEVWMSSSSEESSALEDFPRLTEFFSKASHVKNASYKKCIKSAVCRLVPFALKPLFYVISIVISVTFLFLIIQF